MSTKLAGQVLARLKRIGLSVGLHVEAARQEELLREFEQMLADDADMPVTKRSTVRFLPVTSRSDLQVSP